jgi:hypothetical protein
VVEAPQAIVAVEHEQLDIELVERVGASHRNLRTEQLVDLDVVDVFVGGRSDHVVRNDIVRRMARSRKHWRARRYRIDQVLRPV